MRQQGPETASKSQLSLVTASASGMHQPRAASRWTVRQAPLCTADLMLLCSQSCNLHQACTSIGSCKGCRFCRGLMCLHRAEEPCEWG